MNRFDMMWRNTLMKTGSQCLGNGLLGRKEHGETTRGISLGQSLCNLVFAVHPPHEAFAETFQAGLDPRNADTIHTNANNGHQRCIAALKSATAAFSPLNTASATMA